MQFERLRNLREDRDLTQAEIAKYLNISPRTYSDYENGEILVPITALIKLADYYHVSIDYLVGRTNQSKVKF